MANQYFTNALFDALAEAAKNRDLSAVKEMYNWLVDPIPNKSDNDSALQLTMPIVGKEEKSNHNSLPRAYKYREVLEILDREKLLDRFVCAIGLPPLPPYRISLHRLYIWICNRETYRYFWGTPSFRERLKDALYHSAMNSPAAKKIPLSACIYKEDNEYGFYYYDPNRRWSGNGTSEEDKGRSSLTGNEYILG